MESGQLLVLSPDLHARLLAIRKFNIAIKMNLPKENSDKIHITTSQYLSTAEHLLKGLRISSGLAIFVVNLILQFLLTNSY